MRELARRRMKGLDNDWVSECVVAKLDVDLLREGKTAVFDLLLSVAVTMAVIVVVEILILVLKWVSSWL